MGRDPGLARRRRRGRLSDRGSSHRRLEPVRRPDAVAGRASHPSAAPLDGGEGQGGRGRDRRRHRALRPHRQRRPRAQAAQGGAHHRHQRQVDDHGPDRSHLPPGRQGRPRRRQHRHRRARFGRHARRRGLRAGSVVLPAGPDVVAEARRRRAAQHLARPPGPSWRHGGLCRGQAAGFAEPGQGRHRRDRRRRSLVPADLHRDHRRQPPHHRADLFGPGHRARRLRPAGRALRRRRRTGHRGLRPVACAFSARTPQLAERRRRLRRLPRPRHSAGQRPPTVF